MLDSSNYKSAYIAILGLPNAGKSTLLNALVEKELCITSDRPQTTRNSILGIRHSENYQMLFLDTPDGIRVNSKLTNSLGIKWSKAYQMQT